MIAWPEVRRASMSAAVLTSRSSRTSAPAMNPAGLAERSTSPLAVSFSILPSTSSNSSSTSCERMLALVPLLSKTSQRTSSSSRLSLQCRQGPASWPPGRESGPSSRLRGSIIFQTRSAIFAPRPPLLHHLDQHGAALPAADAFGGDPAFHAEPLHRVDQMKDDPVAAGAD